MRPRWCDYHRCMLDRRFPVGAGIVLTLLLAACGTVIQGAKARPSPTPHPCDRYTLARNDLDALAGQAILALRTADVLAATLALSDPVGAAYDRIPLSLDPEVGPLWLMATRREFALAEFGAERGDEELAAFYLRSWIGVLGAAIASSGSGGCG